MAKTKLSKKQWYSIIAPKIFGSVVLGETYVYEPEQMVGKGITQSLMNLTNDVKRQNININFKVFEAKNDKAFTNIVGYHMVQSSIKRLVRRNSEKIDSSFSCKTADNKSLQIKPFLITRSPVKGSVATKIRRTAKDFLVRYAGAVSYDNLINDLLNHKVQSSLKKELNRVYPLRICEIKSMEIVDLEKREEAKSRKKSRKKSEQKPEKKAEESKGKKQKKEKSGKAEASEGSQKKPEKAKES
ncbi:hypothetical protein KY347_01845 [Candidatus Woesearchaeota archaeon]|nr:hypothetical protein [Candidatus Woesearchaeota archaeon]